MIQSDLVRLLLYYANTHQSSRVKNNQSLCSLLVEDSVAASAASDVIFGFDLDFLLTIGAEIFYSLSSDFWFLVLLLVHFINFCPVDLFWCT